MVSGRKKLKKLGQTLFIWVHDESIYNIFKWQDHFSIEDFNTALTQILRTYKSLWNVLMEFIKEILEQ